MIPYGYEPTAEERYKQSYLSRLRKAEHLSARLKQFIDDVNASKLKEKDKIAVKEAALHFLKISSSSVLSDSCPDSVHQSLKEHVGKHKCPKCGKIL